MSYRHHKEYIAMIQRGKLIDKGLRFALVDKKTGSIASLHHTLMDARTRKTRKTSVCATRQLANAHPAIFTYLDRGQS